MGMRLAINPDKGMCHQPADEHAIGSLQRWLHNHVAALISPQHTLVESIVNEQKAIIHNIHQRALERLDTVLNRELSQIHEDEILPYFQDGEDVNTLWTAICDRVSTSLDGTVSIYAEAQEDMLMYQEQLFGIGVCLDPRLVHLTDRELFNNLYVRDIHYPGIEITVDDDKNHFLYSGDTPCLIIGKWKKMKTDQTQITASERSTFWNYCEMYLGCTTVGQDKRTTEKIKGLQLELKYGRWDEKK